MVYSTQIPIPRIAIPQSDACEKNLTGTSFSPKSIANIKLNKIKLNEDKFRYIKGIVNVVF